MLIGWILCIVGVCLNAMTLVVLTNREQLYTMEAKAARGTAAALMTAPLWCSDWTRLRLLTAQTKDLRSPSRKPQKSPLKHPRRRPTRV